MEQQNLNIEKKGAGIIIPFAIMTFIWSGIWLIIHLIGIFWSGIFSAVTGQALREANLNFINSSGDLFLIGLIGGLVFFIFRLLSIIGAAKMMRLKKSGFTLYIIPNSLTLLLNIIAFSISASSMFKYSFNFAFFWIIYIFASLLFIIIYAIKLKHMD